MSKLPLAEAVERFQSNDERLAQFVNDSAGTGVFETDQGLVVPTLPALAEQAQSLEARLADPTDPLKGTRMVGYPKGRAPAIHTETVLDRLKAGTAKLKADFGAKGNGADDTAAFHDWWDALRDSAYQRSGAQPGEKAWMLRKGPMLTIEGGQYIYAGPGLSLDEGDSTVLLVQGTGSLDTKILLPEDSYLFDLARNPIQTVFKGLTVTGGKGVIRYKSKDRIVAGIHLIRDIKASMYTEAAISNNAVDMPYFRIESSMLYGNPAFDTIGIAAAGLAAGGWIDGVIFGDNRYNIKLAVADNGTERNGPATPFTIARCDFYRTSSKTSNTFDAWIEPGQTTENSGRAILFAGNKFGQENLRAGDAHVLIADSLNNAAGANLSGDRHHSEVKSAGFVSGVRFTDNNVNSQGGAGVRIPYIRSFTPNLGNIKIDDIFDNGMPTHVIEFAGGITQSEIGNLAKTNVFDASGCMALQEGNEPSPLSNLNDVFQVIDPLGVFQEWNRSGQGERVGYAPLFSAATASVAVGDATKTTIPNAIGLPSEGVEITLSASAGRAVATGTGAVAGRQAFLYLELSRADDQSVDYVSVEILNASGAFLQKRRMVRLRPEWKSLVIPFVPNESGNVLFRVRSVNGYVAGEKTKFRLGTLKAYHNECPVPAGHLQVDDGQWSKQHLVLGQQHIWVDGFGVLRKKAGDPTSGTDGAPFSERVSVPASATATGAPGQWAADSAYLYVYTGTGSTHSWRRVAVAAW